MRGTVAKRIRKRIDDVSITKGGGGMRKYENKTHQNAIRSHLVCTGTRRRYQRTKKEYKLNRGGI